VGLCVYEKLQHIVAVLVLVVLIWVLLYADIYCISTCEVIEVTELVESPMNNCIIINYVQ